MGTSTSLSFSVTNDLDASFPRQEPLRNGSQKWVATASMSFLVTAKASLLPSSIGRVPDFTEVGSGGSSVENGPRDINVLDVCATNRSGNQRIGRRLRQLAL